MPAPIVLRNLIPPPKKAGEPPKIATRSDLRDGARGAGGGGGGNPVGVLFQDSFDDQPDWHSELPVNNTGAFPVNGRGADRIQSAGTHTIPVGWDHVYQDPKWSPGQGHPDRRETMQILAENSGMARGGTGKCLLQTKDSSDENGWEWWSDGQLLKLLPPGFDELYIEFYVAFSPNWTVLPSEDSCKLFRVGSWTGEGNPFQAFEGGEQGPLFLWDWKRDNYGVRNIFTLRGGPHGANYTLNSVQKGDLPRGSMNFTTDIVGRGVNGTTPQIPDKLNGGLIPSSGIVEHQQLFGPHGTYTKVAFYVKSNSAPGAADGIVRQWIDDLQVMIVSNVIWVPSLPSGTTEMPKWNFFSIGGNDFFHSYPDIDRRQEFVLFDDVLVRDSIPEELA